MSPKQSPPKCIGCCEDAFNSGLRVRGNQWWGDTQKRRYILNINNQVCNAIETASGSDLKAKCLPDRPNAPANA